MNAYEFEAISEWEIVRPDGSVRAKGEFKNGATTVGLNHVQDSTFRGTTQITSWFIGLIDGTTAPALSAADTSASHTGWTENQDYDEATRRTWSPAASTSGVLSNTTKAEFTMSSSETIYGAFIISNNTKGGTTGTLWSTGRFKEGTQTLSDGEIIKFTYRLTAKAG